MMCKYVYLAVFLLLLFSIVVNVPFIFHHQYSSLEICLSGESFHYNVPVLKEQITQVINLGKFFTFSFLSYEFRV
jgi:hypothetical protein